MRRTGAEVKKTFWSDEGCNKLIEAIVVQAAQDYRQNLRRKKPRKKKEPNNSIRDIERFFNSEWFCMLTNVDGKQLLQALKNENDKGKWKGNKRVIECQTKKRVQ